MIDLAARRLQKVVVENKDLKADKAVRSPRQLFYCDPPYFATENYYKDVGFKPRIILGSGIR